MGLIVGVMIILIWAMLARILQNKSIYECNLHYLLGYIVGFFVAMFSFVI